MNGLAKPAAEGALVFYDDRPDPNPLVARVAALYVENATIGDGHFVSELAMTLREYADLLESGEAGRIACDRYAGPRGTVVTAIGSSLRAGQVRHAVQDGQPQAPHALQNE